MKKYTITTVAILFSVITFAQSDYEKAMNEAFSLWKSQKPTEASQLFERIALVQKDNWLPPYYVASIEITQSFGVKDAVTLNNKLQRAQEFLNEAKLLSKNNPEIIIMQALLNTAYVAFNPQKYGMSLSSKNAALYQKAIQIAPKNPRVILGKAQWDIGSAHFFKQSVKPYCKEIKQAIEIAKTEKTEPFYPVFRFDLAKKALQDCENSK